MFIIGKASEAEIQEMREMGRDVEPVNVLHFDLALDPDLDVTQVNEDRYEENGDQLVAIFVDYDIVQECRDIAAKERALGSGD